MDSGEWTSMLSDLIENSRPTDSTQQEQQQPQIMDAVVADEA